MTRLVLHIDRLVLRGIDPSDAKAISAALQAELQRRLAMPGAVEGLVEGGDRPRIAVGNLRVARGTATGQAASQAIASHLTGRTTP